MNKKTYLIIGSIALVLILIFVLFLVFGGALSENTGQSSDNPFGVPDSIVNSGASSPDSFIASGGQDFVVSSGEIFTPALRKITDAPSSGATIFDTEEGSVVRFVEKATGHVYENLANSQTIQRITNTTIPKIEDVYWNDDGNKFLVRYEKSGGIESFLAEISSEVSTTTQDGLRSLVGEFLPPNITSVAESPDQERLAFVRDEGSLAGIYTLSFETGNPSLILRTPIKEWNIAWAENSLLITTRASAQAHGFSYLLNTVNGSLEKVLGEIFGLTTLPSSPEKFAFSNIQQGVPEFLIQNSGAVFSAPFLTLPEKCVWSEISNKIFCAVFNYPQGANLPDSWYMGITSFSDSIISFDTETFETKILSNLKNDSQEDIDAIELKLSPKEDYLIFRNKRDFTPWILRLESSQ